MAGGSGPRGAGNDRYGGNENPVNLLFNLRTNLEGICTNSLHARLEISALGFLQGNMTGAGAIAKEHHMKRSILKFLNDEFGATAIEYGLIAAGISLAIIAVVNGLGTNLNTSSPTSIASLK